MLPAKASRNVEKATHVRPYVHSVGKERQVEKQEAEMKIKISVEEDHMYITVQTSYLLYAALKFFIHFSVGQVGHLTNFEYYAIP